MKKNKILTLAITILTAIGLVGCTSSKQSRATYVKRESVTKTYSASKTSNHQISKKLAESVLTNNVRHQLGSNIRWNGHGAFII
ncbi:DNA-entry nuclease, partial [Ligilactobacillus sp. LYQ135]